MATRKVGFVGVGRMGAPMVRRLIDAGYEVCAFDTAEDAVARLSQFGARRAASAKEVASDAAIVMMSLPTPDIVNGVALGDDGIVHGSLVRTVIDLSTTGPAMAHRVAAGLAERGIQWVDSPVSGGTAGAVAGTLAIMVSCPKNTFELIQPIIRTLGKVFWVGEKAGLAQVAKLGNNMLSAGALVLSAEALAMGVKAGIDPKVMIDIINVSSGRNSATQDKFPRAILPGTFDFGFTTGLAYKDVRLCVDESETLGVPMMAGAVVRQMLAITNAKYGPDSDYTCIAKVVEDWAGVEIRSSASKAAE